MALLPSWLGGDPSDVAEASKILAEPDPLLPKPDRERSSPAEMKYKAGQERSGVVRDCPLGTSHDRCEWQASGTTAGGDPVLWCAVGSTSTVG
jgi:hypothetical protein